MILSVFGIGSKQEKFENFKTISMSCRNMFKQITKTRINNMINKFSFI